MKKAITIKDIADQLGLSRNTVAKALNGRYVPERTRRLVLDKARELNYKSIASDSSVSSPAKRLLLLSGKPLGNIRFFSQIVRGIENYCFNMRHELFQYIYDADTMTFLSLSKHIKTLNVDGIIAIECFDKAFISNLINLPTPVCFIDFTATSSPIVGNFDIVGSNNTRPIYELTRRLHRQYGTVRFCFVGDYTHCLSFEERYFGMIQALAIDGISHSLKQDILRSDNFNYGNADSLKTEILKLREMPECFICGNDFIARSVCNALKLMGVKVPQKCFVVGFDNVAEACSSSPQITSFGCNREFMGVQAVRTLIDRIESPDTPTRYIAVRAKPVYRESTEL